MSLSFEEFGKTAKTKTFCGLPYRKSCRVDFLEVSSNIGHGLWEVSNKKAVAQPKQSVSRKPDSKRIIYQRLTETKNSTIGEFKIPGTDLQGYFLEPAGPSTVEAQKDRRIPGGVYQLIHHKGTRFPDAIKMFNGHVSKDRAILIHPGNFPKDTEGCFLPGVKMRTDYVGPSRSLFLKILAHFKNVGFEGATMEIKELAITI